MISSLGFKLRVDPLACVLRRLRTTDSPLVRHLLTSDTTLLCQYNYNTYPVIIIRKLLRSANEVAGRLCFYSCLSVHRGLASQRASLVTGRSASGGVCIWGREVCLWSGGSAYRGFCSRVWQIPPDTWDTTGYGQQTGGTHPTGMHSRSGFYQDFSEKKIAQARLKIFDEFLYLPVF